MGEVLYIEITYPPTALDPPRGFDGIFLTGVVIHCTDFLTWGWCAVTAAWMHLSKYLSAAGVVTSCLRICSGVCLCPTNSPMYCLRSMIYMPSLSVVTV